MAGVNRQALSLFARLSGKLGVARIRSDRDLANLVENRLPATVIKLLVLGGLSDAEVYQLILPRRTLAHRVAKHQSLSREESDKAVRVARITALAEQVLQGKFKEGDTIETTLEGEIIKFDKAVKKKPSKAEKAEDGDKPEKPEKGEKPEKATSSSKA